jgi:hypothetical protein
LPILMKCGNKLRKLLKFQISTVSTRWLVRTAEVRTLATFSVGIVKMCIAVKLKICNHVMSSWPRIENNNTVSAPHHGDK